MRQFARARATLLGVFDGFCHARRGHRRLFGGDGAVAEVDEDEADAVVEAGEQDVGVVADGGAGKADFEERHQGDDDACTGGAQVHAAVFLPAARDVVFAVRAFVLGDGLAQQVGAAAPEVADVAAAQAVFDELVQERQPVARFAFGAVGGQYGEQRFEAVKALCEAFEQVGGGKRAAGGDGAAVQMMQLLPRLVDEDVRLRQRRRVGGVIRVVAPAGDEPRQFALKGDEGRVKLQQAFVQPYQVGREVFGAETYREHFQRIGAFFAQ